MNQMHVFGPAQELLGNKFKDYTMSLAPWERRAPMECGIESPTNLTPNPQASVLIVPAEDIRMDAERRLVFRFLSLAYSDRIEIAQLFHLVRDEDEGVPSIELDKRYLRRALQDGHLAELWDVVEQRHPDPASFNPYGTTN